MLQGQRKRLSGRERILVKGLCKGLSITDAAREAGYGPKQPGQSGYQALKHIRAKMPELLERHGLTGDVLIEKYLKPLMSAEETAFAKLKGKITDERNVIAWGPRAQGLELALKLRGDLNADSKADSTPTQIVFDIHIEPQQSGPIIDVGA